MFHVTEPLLQSIALAAMVQPVPEIVAEADGGGGGAAHCPPFQVVPLAQLAVRFVDAKTVLLFFAWTVFTPYDNVTTALLPD